MSRSSTQRQRIASRTAAVALAGAVAWAAPLTGCSKFKSKSDGSDAAAIQIGPKLPQKGCAADDCSQFAFAQTLSTAALFDLYARDNHQLGAFGKSVKFFIDARQADAAQIYFINSNYLIGGKPPQSALLHYDFAQEYLSIPEPPLDYNQVTYFTNDKQYYAGAIQRYHLDSSGEDVYGVQFFPQDVASEATILHTVEMVSKAFHIDGARTAFVAMGVQQTTATVEPQLQALGYATRTIEDVLGSLNYLPMNPGEAWGYLRLFPKTQDDLRPTDIPVFDELPLDLSVVAGVITKAYQDPNSHINLKSAERKTPNMVLRQAAPDAIDLAPFIDKPVHMIVALDHFELQLSTDEEVQARFKERMARPWTRIKWERDTRLLSYDEMCPEDPAQCLSLKHSVGSKAANLGFLAHQYVLGRAAQAGTPSAQVGYDLSPSGFGVPFDAYDRLVNDAANEALKAKLEDFIANEKAGNLTNAERRQLSQDLQAEFLKAKLPADIMNAIRARVVELLPGVAKVKVRSSASSEDLAGFNGAGLYDSFKASTAATDDASTCVVGAKLNKYGAVRLYVAPDTLECAVKAVYASLWNVRAIAERTYARIDHEDAVMGLSIVAAYNHASKVVGNSVLVTRVPRSSDVSGYSISAFKGNNLATNPAPGSYSELSVAILQTDQVPTSITLTRFSKTKADSAERLKPLMDLPQMQTMVDIAKSAEMAYCRAEPSYYPAALTGKSCQWPQWDKEKPKALDFEFKRLANGQFICKQIREFAGGH